MKNKERIEELENQIKEISAEIKQLKKRKKAWPDSFEEAREISRNWGMEAGCKAGCKRYIVCMSGSVCGLAVSADGTWTNEEDMENYWKLDGVCFGLSYYFKPFETAKELYLWKAEGEKE